jgi:hypothetical protein
LDRHQYSLGVIKPKLSCQSLFCIANARHASGRQAKHMWPDFCAKQSCLPLSLWWFLLL